MLTPVHAAGALALLVLGVTTLGCGSTTWQVLAPPPPLAEYGSVVVADVTIDAPRGGELWTWAENHPEDAAELLADITDDLRDALLVEGAPAGRELFVGCRLVDYTVEVNPTKLMGGGSTRFVRVSLDVHLRDGARTLGLGRATGVSTKGGWYIPSVGAAAGRAVDGAVAFLREVGAPVE